MLRSTGAAGAAVLACLVVAAPAAAQRARPRFGLGVSGTLPTGTYHKDDFGDGFNTGWQGLAFIGVQGAHSPLGWRVDFTYGENPANAQLEADASAQVGEQVDASMKMLGVHLDLIFSSPRARGAQIYLLGSAGVEKATLSAKTPSAATDSSESRFAWSVGGGVTTASRMAPFLEARYVHVAEAFDISTLPFFTLTVGVRF